MKEYKFEQEIQLEYGENPQQTAFLYKCEDMADYEVLFEKTLSYDNILNLSCSLNILSEFSDVNATVITSCGNCSSVALGKTIDEAYNKAFDCDPVTAFSGNIGFSKPVNAEIMRHINSMNVKTVIAPDFTPDALDVVKENSDIVLVKIKTPLQNFKRIGQEEIKVTPFGVLIQNKNESELDKETFKVVTKTKPTTEQIEDSIFAWKIAKYTKTNSAVVAKDFTAMGIAQGQANSVMAAETALNLSCDGSKNAVLALDGAVESQEVIFAAAQGRIGLIIQSGGYAKDKDIIALADKYNIAIIVTGIRNYKY